MAHRIALLDANTLYPAPLRDVLLQLAVSDIFRARWSADIHREWTEALLKNRPDLNREKLEITRRMMDEHTRDALVVGYDGLIPSLNLPDDGDRHVLAAAIVGKCDVIVTRNLKHFPYQELRQYGIEAQNPDDFLCNHFYRETANFCSAVRKIRLRLKKPPCGVEKYLGILRLQGLTTLVMELERFADLLE